MRQGFQKSWYVPKEVIHPIIHNYRKFIEEFRAFFASNFKNICRQFGFHQNHQIQPIGYY